MKKIVAIGLAAVIGTSSLMAGTTYGSIGAGVVNFKDSDRVDIGSQGVFKATLEKYFYGDEIQAGIGGNIFVHGNGDDLGVAGAVYPTVMYDVTTTGSVYVKGRVGGIAGNVSAGLSTATNDDFSYTGVLAGVSIGFRVGASDIVLDVDYVSGSDDVEYFSTTLNFGKRF